MALLPRYQRLGIQARQPRSIDFADARESARLGSDISQSVGRMSQFLFKKTVEQETLLGQERVRKEGSAATLEQLQAQGGAKTISEKAAYELGARLAIAEIETDAQVQINNVLAAGELNNTPASEISQQLANINDGFSESINVFDPVAGSVLQQKLSGRTDLAMNKYNTWQSAKYAKELQEKNYLKMGVLADDVINNSVMDGMNPDNIAKLIANNKQILLDLQISEADVNEWAEKTYKSAVQNNTLFRFNQMTISEQEEILEKYKVKPLPGMNLVETDLFMNRLKVDYNNNIRKQTGAKNNLITRINEQDTILENGGMPSLETIESLKNEINQNPFGNRLNQNINNLEFKMQLAQSLRKMSPEEAQNNLIQLEQGLPGYGKKGKDTTYEIEVSKFATKIVKEIKEIAKEADTKEINNLLMSLEPIEKRLEIAENLVKENKKLKPEDLPNSQDIYDWLSTIEKFDEIYKTKYNELMPRIDKLKYIFEIQNKMAKMNPDQMSGFVMSLNESLDKRASPYDYENVTLRLEGLNFAKILQTNKVKALETDPMGYAIKSGVLSVKPIDFTNLSDSLAQRRNEAAQVQEWGNFDTITYLTSDESELLSEALGKGSLDEQLTILATISEQGYDFSLGVFEEIAKNAPELATIGALLTVGEKQSALLALKGIELNKNGFKPIEFTETNKRIGLYNTFGKSMIATGNGMKNVSETANLIYSALADKNQLTFFNEETYEQALQLATGYNVENETGGVQVVRENKTLLPPGISVEEIENKLENITVESIMNASPTNQIIDKDLAKELKTERLGFQDWNIQAIGGNQYVFVYAEEGEYSNNPQYASDVNGELLVINLLDFLQKTSSVNKSVPSTTSVFR